VVEISGWEGVSGDVGLGVEDEGGRRDRTDQVGFERRAEMSSGLEGELYDRWGIDRDFG
jgi:hypothetical protein